MIGYFIILSRFIIISTLMVSVQCILRISYVTSLSNIEEIISEIQHKVDCKTHLSDKEFNKLNDTLNELTEIIKVNKNDQDALIKLKSTYKSLS